MPAGERDAPAVDPPDPERVYRNYAAQCRRMGVKPAPPERAKALIKEWTDSLAAGLPKPPAKH